MVDEFQFIAAQDPGVGSLINQLVERNADNENLKLVIAGSDVSFFRDEVMGYGAVTYGRRTGALRVCVTPCSKKFSYPVPGYGTSRVSCLPRKAGSGISQRPITDPRPGRTATWQITDQFLRFWYRFVAVHGSRLISEDRARLHLEHVMAQLDQFTAAPFEEICRQWLEESDLEVAGVGQWWGDLPVNEKGRVRSRRFEVDVRALGMDGQVVGLGSCNWTNRAHGLSELKKLRQVRDHLEAPSARLYFFSRSGFGKQLRGEAGRDPDIDLVALETLVP